MHLLSAVVLRRVGQSFGEEERVLGVVRKERIGLGQLLVAVASVVWVAGCGGHSETIVIGDGDEAANSVADGAIGSLGGGSAVSRDSGSAGNDDGVATGGAPGTAPGGAREEEGFATGGTHASDGSDDDDRDRPRKPRHDADEREERNRTPRGDCERPKYYLELPFDVPYHAVLVPDGWGLIVDEDPTVALDDLPCEGEILTGCVLVETFADQVYLVPVESNLAESFVYMTPYEADFEGEMVCPDGPSR